MRIRGLSAFKGGLNMLQIVGYCLTVEVVDDQSFTAGSSTLHLHNTITDKYSSNLPFVLFLCSLWCLPVQLTVCDSVGGVVDFTATTNHHFLQA